MFTVPAGAVEILSARCRCLGGRCRFARYGARMYFSVLGSVTVRTTAGLEVDIPEAKVRALLAVLLVNAGRMVSTDRLIDDLWGDRLPQNAAGALQTKVSRLRRALAEPSRGPRHWSSRRTRDIGCGSPLRMWIPGGSPS